jgi:hypothetical protein
MEQQVMGAFLVTTEITDDHEDQTFCLFYVYYSSFKDRFAVSVYGRFHGLVDRILASST